MCENMCDLVTIGPEKIAGQKYIKMDRQMKKITVTVRLQQTHKAKNTIHGQPHVWASHYNML